MPEHGFQEYDSMDEEKVALVDALGVSRIDTEKKRKKATTTTTTTTTAITKAERKKEKKNKKNSKFHQLDQKTLYSLESDSDSDSDSDSIHSYDVSMNETKQLIRKVNESKICDKSDRKSFLSYDDDDYVTSSDEEMELFRLNRSCQHPENKKPSTGEEGSNNINESKKVPWLIKPLSSTDVSHHMVTRVNDSNSVLDHCNSEQSLESSYVQQTYEQQKAGHPLRNRNISKFDITTYQDDVSLQKESAVFNSDTETEDTHAYALDTMPPRRDRDKKVKKNPTYDNEDDSSCMDIKYEKRAKDMNQISMASLVRTENQTSSLIKKRRSRTRKNLHRILILCWVPVFGLLTVGTYILIRVLQGRKMFERPGRRPNIDLREFFTSSSFPRQHLNDTRASDILSRLSMIMSQPSQLTDKLTAQHHAALWLISNDKRNITPDDSNFLQRYALATFYFSTVMDKENHYRTWKKCGAAGTKQTQVCGYLSEVTSYSRFLSPVSECDWYGITCDPYGNVIRIRIHNNGLHGHIPSEISLLHSLTVVSLSRNYMSGGITSSIGKLKRLQVLDLSHNRLNGDIPTEIGNLPIIQSLNLGNNYLEGTIPSSIFVSTLQTMDLGSNKLNGTIPETLYEIPDLETLDISFNSLTGTISSSLGTALDNLVMLRFHSNYLTGSLPEFWSRKDYLKEFNAGMNELTGVIPSSIFRSNQMEYFDVGGNYLSGSISSNIQFMTNLRQLVLWSNLFTGTIPNEISDLNHLRKCTFIICLI